jgi:spore coat polysaccharide biosynthesis predicted glycosyltransferase SpsG
VHVGIADMARRMAESDLAIGAAGGTAWERCCLGLPSLLVVLADNQYLGARALEASGAAILLGDTSSVALRLPGTFDELLQGQRLATMAVAAAQVSDGLGVDRVMAEMVGFDG